MLEAYIPISERINISNKTFYILKCDEKCFASISLRKSGNNNKVSDTLINAIICNMDLSNIPEEDTATNQTCYSNIKFQTKQNKAANAKLTAYKIRYRGRYISKLLEIYASRAYYERELIYYSECIKKIKNAIEHKKTIRIISKDHMRYILPYAIRTDEWSSYNYLIGTEFYPDKGNTSKAISMRIAFISDCYDAPQKEEYKPLDEEIIESKIATSGIQFLANPTEEIKIRMTDKGKNMYDHMIFLRPSIIQTPSSKASDIYTFNCTIEQARVYFFKFGSEVEIISPESLRKEFIAEYFNAYKKYKNTGNDY